MNEDDWNDDGFVVGVLYGVTMRFDYEMKDLVLNGLVSANLENLYLCLFPCSSDSP